MFVFEFDPSYLSRSHSDCHYLSGRNATEYRHTNTDYPLPSVTPSTVVGCDDGLFVGPGEFISQDAVQLNEWTTVIAERNRNDGSLIVNEATAVKGLVAALLSHLLSLSWYIITWQVGKFEK